MISDVEILQRVLIAALLGLIIGYERERKDQSAGLRTHMILIIGAALAMPVSINIAVMHTDLAPGGDAARLASGVVSGVGFLGAGVIFRAGGNVRGLTTAASLWTVAVIGLAVGLGLFLSAAVITVVLLFILTILDRLEDRWLTTYDRIHINLCATDRPGLVDEVKGVLAQRKHRIGMMSIEKDLVNREIMLEIGLRILMKEGYENIINQLSGLEGVQRVKISE